MLTLSHQEEKGAGVDLVIFDNSTCIVLKQVQHLAPSFLSLTKNEEQILASKRTTGFFQSGFAWPVSPLARPVPTTSGKSRCTLMKTTLSVNSPPPRRPVLRSDAARPGCSFLEPDPLLSPDTANGYSEKARFRHSDKAPGRNLDALASMVLTKNEEQILALERITDSPGERRTTQRSTGSSCSSEPRTPNPYPRFLCLKLTTHNLQLILCSFQRSAYLSKRKAVLLDERRTAKRITPFLNL